MRFYKRFHSQETVLRRFPTLVLFVLFGVLGLILLLRTNTLSHIVIWSSVEIDESFVLNFDAGSLGFIEKLDLPSQSEFSRSLEKRNKLPPRNLDLFSSLPDDHIEIVLYVHTRPQYLQAVIRSLSQLDGIGEILLIVSHDGYFEKMNKIVEGVRFCQVKQIFAPYSPHLFSNSFPGVSSGDRQNKDVLSEKNCQGNADQYGNHRSPQIVSLKHHWWWMMNTVWDGLEESQHHLGHILFIEEDHYIFPNAYRNI